MRVMVMCQVLFAAVIGVAAATTAMAGPTLCVGNEATAILKCYADAYAARDSSMFAGLLATDYRYANTADTTAPAGNYESALATTANMFHAPGVSRIVVEFGAPRAVEPGEAPATWALRDVPTTLRIEGESDDGRLGPFTVKSVTTYWVRLVSEPTPHYLIYREEQHDADHK